MKAIISILILSLSSFQTLAAEKAPEIFQCEARQGSRVLKTGTAEMNPTGLFNVEVDTISVALSILNTAPDTYTASVFAKVGEEKHVYSAEGLRPDFRTGFFVMMYPEFPISFGCSRMPTVSRAPVNNAVSVR